MPLPWPAPAWISTRWPRLVNSSTPTGIRDTRDSCVLISLGTPTTYFPLCIREPRNSWFHGPSEVVSYELSVLRCQSDFTDNSSFVEKALTLWWEEGCRH